MSAPSGLERAVALFALAYLAKVFTPFTSGFEIGTLSLRDAAGGNVLEQVLGLGAYAGIGLLVLRTGGAGRRVLSNPILAGFLCLTLASVAWSAAPEVTMRREVGLLGSALVGVHLAQRYPPEAALTLIVDAFGIALLMSVAMIVLVPGFGIMNGDELAGVYGHKNLFGRAMAFAALAFWAVIRTRRGPAWVYPAFAAAVLLGCLAKSAQTVAAMAICFTVIGPALSLLSLRFRRVGPGLLLAVCSLGGLAWIVEQVAAERLLDLLGRDATLTDRTVIWEKLVEFGQEQLWLGRGYAAFWQSGAALYFGDFWGDLDHAHNGYMDLWLDLGNVGVAAFVLVLLSASVRAWNVFLKRPNASTRFFPLFLFAGTLLNLVGRVFPDYNSLYWSLLCYCALIPAGVSHGEASAPGSRVRPSQLEYEPETLAATREIRP